MNLRKLGEVPKFSDGEDYNDKNTRLMLTFDEYKVLALEVNPDSTQEEMEQDF